MWWHQWQGPWSRLSVRIATLVAFAIVVTAASTFLAVRSSAAVPSGPLLRGTLLGLLLALGVGAIATVVFTVLTTRPLLALLRAARRLQGNDLNGSMPRRGPQEFRELATALEDARIAIRAAREDLTRVNAGLSQRVDASAASLTAATTELSVMHTIVPTSHAREWRPSLAPC